MLKKLRTRLQKVSAQKHQCFADFEPIIKKIRADYAHLFPNFSENRNGSRYVYNFGVPGLFPISLEKEHGGREHVPPKFAKRAIQGIEDVLNFIEVNAPDGPDPESEKEYDNEKPIADAEAAAGALPEADLPDGDRGG